MSVERRVQYLLRAAERADGEGNARLATILRKMAAELGPPDVDMTGPEISLNPS